MAQCPQAGGGFAVSSTVASLTCSIWVALNVEFGVG